MKKTLLGNEAIAWGLIHANVDMVSGYPGTPSSEILTTYQKYAKELKIDAYAEWGTNEKVGFEVAYAGAVAGKKTAATMKQVGLNVASDALMSASYIGNLGGFLVVAADDPGFHSSQTEQDSRSFAKFARVPVLDPTDPQEAYEFTKAGVEISEKFQIPTILRPVMRVCHSRQICDLEDDASFNPIEGSFQRDIGRWAAVPRAGRLKQGFEILDKIEEIKEFNWDVLIEPKVKKLKKAKHLILSSGVAFAFVAECVEDLELDIDVLKFDMPYPLPENKIKALFDDYDSVVVIEETYPCIEEQIKTDKVLGKLSGHGHVIDEITKEKVLTTLKSANIYTGENRYDAPSYEEELAVRPPNLCPGCPHRDIYYALTKTFKKKKAIYTSDIGCYTLGLNQGAIDTVLCMGGSISMASGFAIADPEKTVVATIGDSTFIHSGVQPLINAVYQQHKFILVILDNSVVAMTGRQITPESNPDVDIKKIVEGCGVECIEYVYSNDIDKSLDFAKDLKEKYKNANGPVVAIVREFCVLDKDRAKEMLPSEYAEVDPEKCVTCDHCLKEYKCPPMAYDEDGKVAIDPLLCVGCGACLNVVCPTDAFVLKGDS